MRVGAKTLNLINAHIIDVNVRAGATEHVTVDEETIKALRKLRFSGSGGDTNGAAAHTPSAEEILTSIEQHVEAMLRGDPDSPVYESLALRLDRLRQMQLETAADSVAFLKAILEAARDLVAVDRGAAAEASADDEVDDEASEFGGPPEPNHMEALTAIFHEYKPNTTPDIVENVVNAIDAVVTASKYAGWQTSTEGSREVKLAVRVALNKFGLPPTGELFDRAYDYVAAHY